MNAAKVYSLLGLFTLVRFHFKTHNFCYGYTYRLHYSGVFKDENRDFWKRCRPRFSLKTLRLRFSVNGPNRKLLKAMVWQPTFGNAVLKRKHTSVNRASENCVSLHGGRGAGIAELISI